MDAGPRVDNVH